MEQEGTGSKREQGARGNKRLIESGKKEWEQQNVQGVRGNWEQQGVRGNWEQQGR